MSREPGEATTIGNTTMNYFLKRLKEPSTWAGIGLLVSQAVSAYSTRDPVAIVSVIGGVAAVLAPEKAAAK